jgi:hypothetical protein
VPASAQEKLVGTYGEDRTSLAFHIPDATAQNILPQGWLPSPFSAGAAKGAKLFQMAVRSPYGPIAPSARKPRTRAR